ncbi:xanthine dehydrogenase family protein molybdopterin-binding subunit [candidate division KSB1 bacterium]|nr:xanthine dehydrogenase family protein molybdopterin-binding subunit [candidate division KSB1 bacterium]
MKNEKSDQFFENDAEAIASQFTANRREFLKITGAGIFIFFKVGELLAIPQQRRGPEYPEDFNAYLRIGEDGRVACYTGKIEMGQGIITSLAQMLAEELDVALDKVDMVMGDTFLCPYDSATVGSRSTKYFGPPLRKAGAEARAVLIQMAAEQWKVPESQLVTDNGVIKNRNNSRQKVTYSQLVRGKRIERHIDGEIKIKTYAEHKISGKSTFRTDAREKVTGQAKFAGDIRLPDMLYAVILRPPSHAAKLKSVDFGDAKSIEGVRIVQDEDLVAALHPIPEEAEKALQKIKAEWEVTEPAVDNQNIFTHLEKVATEGEIAFRKGSIEAGKALAVKSIDSKYFNHYIAHAPMETHTAVVDIQADEVKVWASTQAPFRVQSSVAELLNMPKEKVHVIMPFVGGGFGGKTWIFQVTEAVRLAKLTGKPVQVAWTRKEEFFYDSFRPAAVINLSTGIDNAGKIVYWDYELIFTGTRSSEPIYDIPHYQVKSRGGRDGHPFYTGAWRGPGSNTNVFAMESQTDLMAEAADMDPLSFRLKNLNNDRMKRVLEAAANQFGHSFSKTPGGKGYGIACTDYLGTYVATIAEVKVDKNTGQVKVERIVCAQDMGEIINPQGAKLQIEGCMTMGLSSVLTEEIQFQGGKVLTENFDSYEITRFSWLPKIEVVLVDNPEMPPQGCGEPAITTTGAVLANAVYDAIGVRLYTLPMTPGRILEALGKG